MKDDFLKEFLNIFWLRPETAILNALLAKNLPANYLQGVSADLSCGDGLFAFTANGGKLNKNFNLYQNTNINSNIIKQTDIYNFYKDTYKPEIIQAPDKKYNFGIDINDTMLHKANKLNIYENLCKYIDDKPFNLNISSDLELFNTKKIRQLEDIKFDTVSIFSSSYMYSDTRGFLKSLNNILNENGKVILNIKNENFKKFYKQLEKNYTSRFSKYLERDMRNIFPSLHSVLEWEDLFHKNNFIIEQKKATLHDNLTAVWSIGLRFLTPLLVKMSNYIVNEKDFLEIKEEFTTTFYEVLQDFYYEDIKEASSYLYVLKKR